MKIESKLRKNFKPWEFDLMEHTVVDVDLADAYVYERGKAEHHQVPRVGVLMHEIAAKTRVFNSELKTRKYAAIERGRERIRKSFVAQENIIFDTLKRKGYQGYYCTVKRMPDPELTVISRPRSLMIVMWYRLGAFCVKKGR
jgi:hypothetical protein